MYEVFTRVTTEIERTQLTLLSYATMLFFPAKSLLIVSTDVTVWTTFFQLRWIRKVFITRHDINVTHNSEIRLSSYFFLIKIKKRICVSACLYVFQEKTIYIVGFLMLKHLTL
jgi:hypothetical protein